MIAHLVIGGDVAGGQKIALRLARAARDAGLGATIVAPAEGELATLARVEALPVHVLELGRSLRADRAAALRSLLRRERVSLLHTHTHLAGNVLGRLAARTAGIPVVSHMHIENRFRGDRLGRAAQIALDDASARLCARIVAVSEATRAALVRQGYPRRLLEVVPNGIAPTDAPPIDLAELGLPDQARVVLHVGRLCDVKGQRELIEALARLPDDVHAVLVGRDLETGGAYERMLRRAAEDLGVGTRVVFAGYRDDVPALLAAADVLALPSWIEGLPLVVLEAMAQGRPVVATPVGGTSELVVPGETGLLVPPRDPAALAAALVQILHDPAAARALGRAGRRRVEERFSERAMVERVLAIYGEVLA